MVFTAGIFIYLIAYGYIIIDWRGGGPDLGEVAEFQRDWERAYTTSEKNELLKTLGDIDKKIMPEWSTPEERIRWMHYVSAHQLGYWADKADEALSLRASQLLEKNGIVDGYVGCIYLHSPEAAEVGEPTRLALEELGFTLMTEVCPLVTKAQQDNAFTHGVAKSTWLSKENTNPYSE
jgi:hypothetical protein